jgi:hypothetical protein
VRLVRDGLRYAHRLRTIEAADWWIGCEINKAITAEYDEAEFIKGGLC